MGINMKLANLALTLIIPLALAACAPGSRQQQQASSTNTFSYKDAKAAQFASDKFTLSCASTSCPANVGAVLVKKGSEITTCTFSLVGEDVVLTNRHCIPDEIAQDGSLCPNISLIFNQNGVKQVVECANVISVPAEYQAGQTHQLDYAFLRLKTKMVIPFLALDNSGIQDQETLTAFTVTPNFTNKEKPSATIESKTCTADMNTVMLSTFQSAQSPVALFKGCLIQHGNSGSPLLGANGQIKAVGQAAYLPPRNYSIKKAIAADAAPAVANQTYNNHLGEKIIADKVSLATNVACMDAPALGLNHTSEDCGITSQKESALTSQLYIKAEDDKKILQQVNDLVTPINAQAVTLKWIASPKIRPVSAAENKNWKIGRFSLIPLCIKADATVEQGTLNAPEMTVSMDTDDNLRPVTAVDSTSQTIAFSTSLAALKADPTKTITVHVQRDQAASETYNVGVCH